MIPKETSSGREISLTLVWREQNASFTVEMHSEKKEQLEQRRLERTGCVSNVGNSGGNEKAS